MTRMTRSIRGGLVGAALATLTLLTPAARAQTTLNMSIWIPPQAPFVQHAMLVWGKQAEDATAGRVKVRLLPKAVTSAPQHFDAIKDGLADVTFIVHGYTPGRFVLTKIAELPFLGDQAEALSVAYNRVHDRTLAKANEHQGVKLLAVFTHGPGQMYLTRKHVEKLEDLAGLKFRTGGGIVNDLAAALGVTGVLKPAPEVYELLSSGVADGVFFARESILTFKLAAVVKEAVLVPDGLFNTSFALIMNEAKFKALSAADQQAIMKVSGDNFARLAGQSFDKSDSAALGLMRDNKVNLTTASAAFVGQLRTATQPVVDKWVKESSALGVDGGAALQALRAEAKKVNAK